MTLKKEFTASNLIMLIVPVTAIIVVTVLLFVLGFAKHIETITNSSEIAGAAEYFKEMFMALYKTPAMVQGALLWIFICVAIIAVTSTIITRNLSKNILTPLSDLKEAARRIEKGDLDFEVLSGKYKEINELCTAFNNMRKKLKESREKEEQLTREKNLMLAHLSHDLKTPITSIKGYAEGISDGIARTPEKLDSYIETIIAKSEILENLASNLSEYSHLELNKTEFRYRLSDICDFLREIALVYNSDFQNHGITLKCNIPDEKIILNADFEKLYRVFSNVLDNAIKYRHKDSKITVISAEKKDGGIYITVTDDGIGITTENSKKAFDNFYRENKARTMNIKGNGLGLGIARKITELHGGKIWLTAAEVRGTVATVYLPIYEEKFHE